MHTSFVHSEKIRHYLLFQWYLQMQRNSIRCWYWALSWWYNFFFNNWIYWSQQLDWRNSGHNTHTQWVTTYWFNPQIDVFIAAEMIFYISPPEAHAKFSCFIYQPPKDGNVCYKYCYRFFFAILLSYSTLLAVLWMSCFSSSFTMYKLLLCHLPWLLILP